MQPPEGPKCRYLDTNGVPQKAGYKPPSNYDGIFIAVCLIATVFILFFL